jgi:hypothetical protein
MKFANIWNDKKNIIIFCLTFQVLSVGAIFAQPVVLSIPKFKKAPTINGSINKTEWSGAASITGVCTFATGDSYIPSIVPEFQQVAWYLGYDNKNLYIAMDSPYPKGVALKSDADNNYQPDKLLLGDHVEIQISPYGRKKAVIPGYGFYKIMVDPQGYYSEQWFYNGTPGTEDYWRSGAEIKCHVTKTDWQLTMAIPFKGMGQKKAPNGKKWIIQLVRTDGAGGIYFAGWVGSDWMGWNVFPMVVFNKNSPVFHLEKIGDISNGSLDTKTEIIGNNNRQVAVSVSVTNAQGKEIYKNQKIKTLKKEIPETFTFKAKNLPLSLEKDQHGVYQQNFFEIRAISKEKTKDGEKENIIYQAKIPVIKMTKGYWAKYIKPWLNARETAGEYKFKFANYPYLHKFQAWINLNMFGVPEIIKSADKFSIVIETKAGRIIKQISGEINDFKGTTLFGLDLKPGKYLCVLNLYKGNRKVSEEKINFARKKWDWEHNTIGEENIVIPPYTPITVKENTLNVIGRQYIVGKTGFPDEIIVKGKNILEKPIYIVMKSEGKTYYIKGKNLNIKFTSPTKVLLTGESSIGDVNITVDVKFAYDGWYLVNLHIIPERRIKIDSLDMVWEEIPEADTLVIQRGDSVGGGYFGEFEKKDGFIFKSKNLNPEPNLIGTWAPACFIGTGNWGLWYIAKSDEGWVGDTNHSAIIAERKNNIPCLIFRFISKPYIIKKEDNITFALIATPVKPLPANWRKIAWNYPEPFYIYTDSGYRTYGQSVDGFELYKEQDYKNLRDVWLGLKPIPKYSWAQSWLLEQKPIIVYGSTEMTGISKEFKTFAGEWLGTTNYTPSPQEGFKGKQSMGGITWETPDQLSSVSVNFTNSYLDYYLWYYRNLVKKCFINGTWWDNSSIVYGGQGNPESWPVLGLGYVRSDGQIQGDSSLFTFRKLSKRLCTMGWEEGRPPLYMSNMSPVFSFTQIGWHIENSFYSPSGDLLQTVGSVNVFRALILSKQGIIHQLYSNNIERNSFSKNPKAQFKATKVVIGLCLLNDIGEIGTPQWVPYEYQFKQKCLNILQKEVSFFTGDPQFIPYWNQNIVSFSTPHIYASIYKYRPQNIYSEKSVDRAVIILLNGNDKDTTVKNFYVNAKQLGWNKIDRIQDGLTGFNIPLEWSNNQKTAEFGEGKAGEIFVKGHEFRLLVVEGS